MDKILIASHNQGKIKEFKEILEPLGIEVISAADLQLADVEETGKTFAENAEIKAKAMSLETGFPCIADDSGLCVDALEGRPGVYSARYAPNRDFGKAMDMVLEEIAGSGSQSRSAHFMCVLALCIPQGRTYLFEGRVDGTIALEKKGDKGFGYDQIFVTEGYDRTFGELAKEIKNSMSHRSRAVQKFIEFMKKQNG